MKKYVLILSIIIQMLVASSALAFTVDFSGVPYTDITATPYTLGDVTFAYDNFGTPASASIDELGVYGNTDGVLKLSFLSSVSSITLGYNLFNVYSSDLVDGSLLATTKLAGGGDVDLTSFALFTAAGTDPTFGAFGDAVGTLTYSGAFFDEISLYFAYSDLGANFTVDSISYASGPAPVPEPATVVLLGAGLFGLAVYGKRRMNLNT